MTGIYIFLGILLLAMAFLKWYDYCLSNTISDLQALHNYVFDYSSIERIMSYEERYDGMKDVDFTDHFKNRLFGGDPWSIYSENIQQAMRKEDVQS